MAGGLSRCSDATAADHETGFHYYAQRDASAGVVSARQQCMANLEGFHCWAEPESQDITIVLSLKEPEPYTISDATLSQGATLRSSPASIAPGHAMPFGQTRIVVQRKNQSTSISVTLNITTGAHARSCRVAVPAVVTPPPTCMPPPPPRMPPPIAYSATIPEPTLTPAWSRSG